MMTCEVCGKIYDEVRSGTCPRCGFEPDDFLIGDAAAADPMEYQKSLLRQLDLGVETYSHHAEGDVVVPDPETTRIVFGNAADLGEAKGVVWLPDELCAVLDCETIDVTVSVYRDGKPYHSAAATVETLPQHELLQLGVKMIPGTLQCRIHLRNTKEERVSAPVFLLRD